MIIGAHVSIAGGIENAVSNAEKIGCETFQIFTKNQNQWREKKFSDEEIHRFNDCLDTSPFSASNLAVHVSYLVNLCAVDEEIIRKSRSALAAEIRRCEDLKIPNLVLHPGSHRGNGEEWGLQKIAESIEWCISQSPDAGVRILLETTAGQGTNLGYRFEHLSHLLRTINHPGRIGVCVDTCHIFSAGYDLSSQNAWNQTVDKLSTIVGLENIYLFHLNDSQRDLGSRIDRHERIGEGKIGANAFRLFMNDTRFEDVPAILEIPGGENAFKKDIEELKQFRISVSG
jgi:deoxyribonuclease-4